MHKLCRQITDRGVFALRHNGEQNRAFFKSAENHKEEEEKTSLRAPQRERERNRQKKGQRERGRAKKSDSKDTNDVDKAGETEG